MQFTSVAWAGVVMAAVCMGCHSSDLEPESPIRHDWAKTQWQEPVMAMPQWDVPPVDASNPAPTQGARPRSISLGFIGDEPLTPPPATVVPRWPYVQEPFHMEEQDQLQQQGR
jgi:hypothetical protein